MEAAPVREAASSGSWSATPSCRNSSPSSNLLWACPFHKADPDRFSGCSRKLLRGVHRVKEHIYRNHKLIHCFRCHAVFDTQDDLNSHLIGNDRCDAVGTPPPVLTCGINKDVEKHLRSRPQPGSDDESRWFAMWDIIFPGSNRPLTPFVEEPYQIETTAAALAAEAAVKEFTDSVRTELVFLVRKGMCDALVQSGTETPNTQIAVDVVMEGFNKQAKSFIQLLTKRDTAPVEPQNERNAPPPRIPTPDREKSRRLLKFGDAGDGIAYAPLEDDAAYPWPHSFSGFTTHTHGSGSFGEDSLSMQWAESGFTYDLTTGTWIPMLQLQSYQ